MLQTAHASANFGAEVGRWSSITVEACEPGQGSVYALAKLTALESNRAMRDDAGYLDAIQVTRPGTAAWWVYGNKVRVALLTDERAFAESMMNVSAELESLARRTMTHASTRGASPTYSIPDRLSYTVQSRRLIRSAIEAASLDSTATVSPQVSFQISREEITFSDSALEHTRHLPQSTASVFFAGSFVSAANGLPLVLHQNEPGVFSLSEPGYGMLVVSYMTTRQMVTVPYDLWLDSISPEMREEIARETVLMSTWPDEMVPKIVALVSREEAPEVQALITAPRKVGLDISAAFSDTKKEPPKLKEESRETETKTIKASNDQNQTVTFKRVKKVKLRDQNGKIWEMEFVNE